jgi:diguanylate cyclase (GGDEF)-like protein/PAS domain S-box-containing protein
MTSPPEPVLQARILMVDDEEVNLDVLTAQLSREGYSDLTALTDPREVVPVCLAAQPDLILLDLHMPHLDGFAVLAQLQTIIPPDCYLPILVLTADISMEARHRALRAGAHDFVTKPFDRTEVLLRVRTLLQTRALHRTQTQRHRRLAEHAAELTAILSPDGRIQYASPSFEPIVGRPPDALLGTHLRALVHAGDQPMLDAALAQCRNGSGVVPLTAHRMLSSTAGDETWQIVEGSVVNRLDDPVIRGLIVTAHDVTERARLQDQVQRDPVTHLPSYVGFQEILADALGAQAPGAVSVALLLVSLSGIADVVPVLGRATADHLLQEVATRLSAVLRPGDSIARTGDTQFALVAPQARVASVLWAARKVLTALAAPALAGAESIVLHAAVGVALCPDHGCSPAALERAAALALATAGNSPAGYCLFAPALEQQVVRQHSLVAALRDAIGQDQLVLHYQPKLDLRRGHCGVQGVEALVRWRHPREGLILPDEFIGLAEQHGLIDELTRWVLETALRQCRDWARGGRMLDVAVNVSMRSLTSHNLPRLVRGLLRQYGVPPTSLVLEITESAFMANPDQTLIVLRALASQGVRLSIDDFGTGYSSLAYLRRLPVSELKIDRSFITGLTATARDRALVETIIALGQKLHLAVVAEGVEDQDTLTLLGNLGCSYAQGYHISRPLPAGDFSAWLEASRWGLLIDSQP